MARATTQREVGARFYSTRLGRFLSADPLVVSPGDPQALDRYAYVRNNPLRYVDPTGLGWEELTPSQWSDLAAAGRELGRSYGVPESEWGRSLRTISGLQNGSVSPNSPAFYVGRVSGSFIGTTVEMECVKGFCAIGYGPAEKVYYSGELRVVLPPSDAPPLGGRVYFLYTQEGPDTAGTLIVNVAFSSGRVVTAHYSVDLTRQYALETNYIGGGQTAVLTSPYEPDYGYPVGAYFTPRGYPGAPRLGVTMYAPVAPVGSYRPLVPWYSSPSPYFDPWSYGR